MTGHCDQHKSAAVASATPLPLPSPPQVLRRQRQRALALAGRSGAQAETRHAVGSSIATMETRKARAQAMANSTNERPSDLASQSSPVGGSTIPTGGVAL